MRASACIGRVGGLAVALGVGAAVATGAVGVASATPAQDSSSEPDSAARAPAAGSTRTAPRTRERAATRSTRPGPAAERNDSPAPLPKRKQRWASEATGPVGPAEPPGPVIAVAPAERAGTQRKGDGQNAQAIDELVAPAHA